MMDGKFIVFEGIDGAGKSTQVELLTQKLAALGYDVRLTAEPTALQSGKALRRALSGSEKRSECEMAVMFTLDRVAHNIAPEDGIQALCDGGAVVICDRYYYSTLAYQGQSTSYEWTKKMNVGCPEIRRPDLCIYLDLLPEQSLARIRSRNEAVEIYENTEKLTKVRNAFLSVIDDLRADGEKIFVIDASRSVEAISDEIFSLVQKNLFNS